MLYSYRRVYLLSRTLFVKCTWIISALCSGPPSFSAFCSDPLSELGRLSRLLLLNNEGQGSWTKRQGYSREHKLPMVEFWYLHERNVTKTRSTSRLIALDPEVLGSTSTCRSTSVRKVSHTHLILKRILDNKPHLPCCGDISTCT